MALDRDTKENLVSDYTRGFAASPHAFVLGFSRMSVPQADALRAQVRERGGRYQVVKNRLARIAMQGTTMEELAAHFEGPTAVAYSSEDPVGLAKALTDFAKEADVLDFRAGLLDGSPIEAAEIKTIAELPSREELLAKLVFLLQSPIARAVRGLGGITQQFVAVVEQIRQQKESQPQPAAQEPQAEAPVPAQEADAEPEGGSGGAETAEPESRADAEAEAAAETGAAEEASEEAEARATEPEEAESEKSDPQESTQ